MGGFVAERGLARGGDGAYPRLAIAIEAAKRDVIAQTRAPLVVGAALALCGVHATVWGALLTSLRRELTPDRRRGRVGGVHGLIEDGAAVTGTLPGGLLAVRFDLTAPFWLGAGNGARLLPLVWSGFSEAAGRAARKEATTEDP